jgi:hypothetical protein
MALPRPLRTALIDFGAAALLVASLGMVYMAELRRPRPPEGTHGTAQVQRDPKRESLLTPPPNTPSDQESRLSASVSTHVESGDRPRTAPKKEEELPPEPKPKPEPKPEPEPEPFISSVYGLRTAVKKETLISQLGGSLESERAVQAGLDWLVRHQAEDGSWSNACLGPKSVQPRSRCEATGPPCTIPGENCVMAQTGLALLALQAAGHYDFNERPYSGQVRRGLEWLTQHQGRDGALARPPSRPAVGFGRPPSARRRAKVPVERQVAMGSAVESQFFMYEHAIAAFALAEACAVRKATGQKPDERIDRSARMAIQFIADQQHDDGGWRYTTNKSEGGDTSVSGWAMLALKSALEAGLPVSQETVSRTRAFFQRCEGPGGRTGYTADSRGSGSDAVTGVGILVHLLLLKEKDSPLAQQAAPSLAERAESYALSIRAGQAEFYTLYNVTLALYQAGGSHWDRWNQAIRDAVIANQVGGQDCNRGSWDPEASWGGTQGGRVYSTALGTLTMEVYYRYARQKD